MEREVILKISKDPDREPLGDWVSSRTEAFVLPFPDSTTCFFRVMNIGLTFRIPREA
jgi:hypothetical protein